MLDKSFTRRAGLKTAAAAVALLGLGGAAEAQQPPIRIGYGMSLTGGLAVNGKAAIIAHEAWRDDVNAKGGLLGRKVELVYYDDQSNPSTVPALYQKLISVDKVDFVIGGYATVPLAAAMPVVMQHNKVFVGLFGLAVNEEFKYPKYFSMAPPGPDPKPAFTKGFFDIAMQQNPKPQTVAIIANDLEFSKNAADGARENAKKAGLRIVYDRSYPPTTPDFTPIARAIQATNADLVVVCSYPPDSLGMVRAANEVGLKPKMFGGAMVGLQATAIKTQLGPLLNGIVNYDFWLPASTMQFPGALEFLKLYQAKAPAAGVDTLGYYIPAWAYAQLEVLGQAIEATKSLDQEKIADHLSKATFKTLVGDVKFGKNGEWAEERMLQVQYQNIKGNAISEFTDMSKTVIVTPAKYATGKAIYPFTAAK
ncbi:MAG: branched-chain amino acid ABC transporter substrate-binding protein [Alphaproteobacteria bacterium]|nr:branched-chain amino acid ABC transporter substrate-binding protein [Alphaproteobacteria bacterium]